MKIVLYSVGREVLEQGAESLVSLSQPILAKDGKMYRYLQGPVSLGFSVANSSLIDRYFQIGPEDNCILIPVCHVISIQECHKVLKNAEVLVLAARTQTQLDDAITTGRNGVTFQ